MGSSVSKTILMFLYSFTSRFSCQHQHDRSVRAVSVEATGESTETSIYFLSSQRKLYKKKSKQVMFISVDVECFTFQVRANNLTVKTNVVLGSVSQNLC